MNSSDAKSLRDQNLATLSRLAEIGMKIAMAIELQADTVIAGDVEAKTDFNLFPKIARWIRLTLMLQEKLLSAPKSPQAAWAKADRVERIIRRVAEAEGHDGLESDTLAAEAGDRLESEDLYGDITSIPTSDLIARLCKDLDLNPDWSILAEEHWAQEEISSNHIGQPLQHFPLGRKRRDAIASDVGGNVPISLPSTLQPAAEHATSPMLAEDPDLRRSSA